MKYLTLSLIEEFIRNNAMDVICDCYEIVQLRPCIIFFPVWNDITMQEDISADVGLCELDSDCKCSDKTMITIGRDRQEEMRAKFLKFIQTKGAEDAPFGEPLGKDGAVEAYAGTLMVAVGAK